MDFVVVFCMFVAIVFIILQISHLCWKLNKMRKEKIDKKIDTKDQKSLQRQKSNQVIKKMVTDKTKSLTNSEMQPAPVIEEMKQEEIK